MNKETKTDSFVWHTTPLHYLPYLLQTGTLLSATRLQQENHPILPRPSAIRRKTKLGLADYVHLSHISKTPLLRDKQTKNYPHALIAFPRDTILALPGTALLKFNTKRWTHRDEFIPVTNPDEQATIWHEYASGKYPSLEILVPGQLPLTPFAQNIHVSTTEEAELLESLISTLKLRPIKILVAPEQFPLQTASDSLVPSQKYFAECKKEGRVLPPPSLPFD